MKRPTISVIITNKNTKHCLKDCFSSLEKQDFKNYEIIFVDNASTDGSVEFVKKICPQAKIIVNLKDEGFAGANNIGYKKAQGRYILLLSTDTLVTKDFLSSLLKRIKQDSRIAVVQPKIIFYKNKLLQAGGAFLTNTGFLYYWGAYKNPCLKKYQKERLIFSANGTCMLIKRKVIEKVGLFDSDFFVYFEESDFCWRVWLAGYKILYYPQSVIYHIGGQAIKRMENEFILFHSFKNRICSLIKNLSTKELVKTLPLHIIFCQFFAFLSLIKKPSVFMAIQKAIGWNIVYLKITLAKRKQVQQKIRKTHDGEIFKIIKINPRILYYLFLIKGLESYND